MRCTITLPGRIRETAFSERFKKSVRLFLSFPFLSSPAVCLSRLLDAYPTPAVFPFPNRSIMKRRYMVGTDTTPMRLTRKDFDNPEVLNARNPHPHWGFTHGKSTILHDAFLWKTQLFPNINQVPCSTPTLC